MKLLGMPGNLLHDSVPGGWSRCRVAGEMVEEERDERKKKDAQMGDGDAEGRWQVPGHQAGTEELGRAWLRPVASGDI